MSGENVPPGAGPGDRRGPKRIDTALSRVVAARAPRTLLAAVQEAWPEACGPVIAANSEPVSERDGAVTIACATGAWAQELELMGDELLARIDARVEPGRVLRLRFTADLARHR